MACTKRFFRDYTISFYLYNKKRTFRQSLFHKPRKNSHTTTKRTFRNFLLHMVYSRFYIQIHKIQKLGKGIQKHHLWKGSIPKWKQFTVFKSTKKILFSQEILNSQKKSFIVVYTQQENSYKKEATKNVPRETFYQLFYLIQIYYYFSSINKTHLYPINI